ncbi:hypothetical protein J2Z22_003676 [Paenibacillus forsythiae]|uniref:Uncharacterized protein n=1 Tax=Paenibacillus forsythiae TaxID=365616 RepID=A0ABU3HC98_9BACL|nr:hypothetical protein [Paenibacillus forsythiae]MDT3428086.1 hypothetical protein [Paenibacillus forsythiae]
MSAEQPVQLRSKFFSLFLVVAVLTTLLFSGAKSAFAATNPVVTGFTITSYYDSSLGTDAAREDSQKVYVDVTFDQAITVASGVEDDFSVSIAGSTLETDGSTTKTYTVDALGTNGIRFTILPYDDDSFFALMAANLTITAASGTSIPSITAAADATKTATWTSSTLSEQLINTGVSLSGISTVTGNTSTSTKPSVTASFNNLPQVRGISWFYLKSTIGGTTTIIPCTVDASGYPTSFPAVVNGAFPIHSHNFYSAGATASSYATQLANFINGNNTDYGDYSVTTSGGQFTITRDTAYSTGEVLSIEVHNYLN